MKEIFITIYTQKFADYMCNVYGRQRTGTIHKKPLVHMNTHVHLMLMCWKQK